MRLLLYTHESALAHDTGPNHPERPARVGAVLRGIRKSGAAVLDREATPIAISALHGVHGTRYVESIRRFCESGGGYLDADTHAVPASWDAALRSAGAGVAAAAALDAGEGDAAFIVMRPPGHHALADRAMGFCLFNNIAVTAHHLLERGDRVAIVDWDVHHGNGTQAMFYANPNLLYVSLHEFPAYPGTGWADEVGTGDAAGTTVNFPFPAGTGTAAYRAAIDRLVGPILDQFDAEWVLVSAGYDAHAADPLAGIRLQTPDYHALASAVASRARPGRLLLFLEGGYDLDALEGGSEATVRGAAAAGTELPETGPGPTGTAARILDYVTEVMRMFWDVG
jgi:acetoin utilization deacetylase AcuC-like enzyme